MLRVEEECAAGVLELSVIFNHGQFLLGQTKAHHLSAGLVCFLDLQRRVRLDPGLIGGFIRLPVLLSLCLIFLEEVSMNTGSSDTVGSASKYLFESISALLSDNLNSGS